MLKLKFNFKYYLAGLVSLITFLVYITALQNDFIWWWDDGQYVVNNFHIRLLDTAFFKWAFFDFYENNWHPLTWISHAFDYAVWGLNPLGHHLTNVVLHAANAALVVLLTMRLLETANERKVKRGQPSLLKERIILIAAATTGLLFGLHPVHVQSVAWVAERKDILCALFFLLSIMTYVSYVRNATDEVLQKNGPFLFFFNKHYLLSLGLFVLALLSKPMAVSLPIVLLILDWYPFNRLRSLMMIRSALVEKLPFIVLSFSSSVLTVLAQRAGGALGALSDIPLSIRILVAIKSLIAYLGKMIWPLNLVPYYPYPKHVSLFSLEYFSAVALVIGIVSASIVMAKKQRLWLSAWGYYVATLIPVLGIVQVGGQAMADRYLYLPSLGPFLVMGLGAGWIVEKTNVLKTRIPKIKAFCAVAAAVVLFASLSYLTIKQIAIWKNSIVFWSYIIDKDPGKFPKAYNNRGVALVKEGMPERAIDDFNTAIALDPSYDEAFYGRGTAYDKMNNLHSAIDDFNTSIALDPLYFEAFLARGMVYEKMGQIDKAVDDFNRSISLNPIYDKAYFRLGVLYAQRGLFDKAINYINSAVSINPNYSESYINRAILNSLVGRQDMALKDFNRALLLDHNNSAAYLNRGNFYFRTGKGDFALADFKKACDLGSKEGCSLLNQLTNPVSRSSQ
jgi:protein O-mannosyl-transferase